jgi:pyruvate kinase
VATLGPSSDDPAVLQKMIEAGLNVARLNFSHGNPEDHRNRARNLRECSERAGKPVGLLADLQGPKIRIERFVDNAVTLTDGARFVLDAECPRDAGNSERVGITYKELPGDLGSGDVLLLDDGRVILRVLEVAATEIHTEVLVGGELSNNKGINRRGGGLSAPTLTDKDRTDIELAAELDADYLAVSFPRNGEDIEQARRLFREAGGHGGMVAKIERAEALEAIDDILAASDAIMIARGDLGVEIGDAELPAVQKRLIDATRSANRVAITATQMMESMIDNPIPTRAEVFDVANAVLDGTDAVMLSAETATGNHPVRVVESMGRVCAAAEQHRKASVSRHRLDSLFERTDEAIAMASMYAANHLGVRAIASLTESGATVLWMSRISSGIPIYALTRHDRTRRKVTLYRGVYPVRFDEVQTDHDTANRRAIEVLTDQQMLAEGDRVIVTMGDTMGVDGGTNVMKIIRVGGAAAPGD